MQIEQHFIDGRYVECPIPDAGERLPTTGVLWGAVDCLFTPAYWRFAYLTEGAGSGPVRYKLADSLRHEVVVCLLGGHGVRGELGNAAFQRLRASGILDGSPPDPRELERLLLSPLNIGGRRMRYRYPTQKARYIAGALEFLNTNSAPPKASIAMRDWLLAIPGVGMKTAAWITRNWLDAEDVAVLDIHIHRAGVIAGFFGPDDDVSRDYRRMERDFVAFCQGIGVPANALDHLMWTQLRRVPNIVRHLLIERGATSASRCGLPAAKQSRSARNYELLVNA